MSVKAVIRQSSEFSILMLLSAFMIASSFTVIKPIEVNAATDTYNSTGSWVAPTDVKSVTIEAWGGGGGGPSGTATSGRGGGGGGAYSSSIVTVIPNSSYTVTVGGGGVPGSNGGDSWFSTSGTVLAKGGTVGGATTGGGGGLATASIGTTKWSGGNGGNQSIGNGRGGGGGGGSATAVAVGGNGGTGSNNVGGVGGTGQATGGNGGDSGITGFPGNAPGAGGGGGGRNAASGSGAAGRVTITYIIPIISVTVSDASVSYGILGNSTSRDTTASGSNDTQVATNNGNLAEDFNIVGQNSADWVLGGTAANNQYVHYFCTAGSGSPDPCDTSPTWTALSNSYQTLSTNVLSTANSRFDLRITTPTSTSATSQQSVNVTIQAVIH